MNNQEIGKVIKSLRIEQHLTQKQLADRLNISDKTISKWEGGYGCPEITLWPLLAEVFKVPVDTLLKGELVLNNQDSGNLKRVKFYYCMKCGNTLFGTGSVETACCGKVLKALPVQQADADHRLNIQAADGEYYLSYDHPMHKDHYLVLIAYVTSERIMVVRLYPEQAGSLYFPLMRGGKFYLLCNKDGLFCQY